MAEVRKPDVNIPKLRVMFGKTINIGEFESMRVDYAEEDLVPDEDQRDDIRDALIKRTFDVFTELVGEIEEQFKQE